MPDTPADDRDAPTLELPEDIEAFEEHREALEQIAESDAPDAHVARLVLDKLDGRDPDPADLDRLSGPSGGSGGFGRVMTPSPRVAFERAAASLFERLERAARESGRGGE